MISENSLYKKHMLNTIRDKPKISSLPFQLCNLIRGTKSSSSSSAGYVTKIIS